MTLTDFLPRLRVPTADAASAWIAAVLAEADALRQYDGQLFPFTADPKEMEAAECLHQTWREWAEQAAALRDQLGALNDEGDLAEPLDRLSYAIARTRAMLQITPQRSLRAKEQLRRGEGVSLAEARAYVAQRRREA